MQRYLDPTNDSLFKKIFRDLERLKEFINAVLELPEGFRIKEIEFIPVEQVPIIDKGKKSIYNVIEMHNLTPEEYDAYIRAKLMEDAEEIALPENFEKGKAELIQMMLKQGKTVQQIIEFTGLSKEEIEELKAKIENSKAS